MSTTKTTTRRPCAHCRGTLPKKARADARFCSDRCRKAAARVAIARTERGHAEMNPQVEPSRVEQERGQARTEGPFRAPGATETDAEDAAGVLSRWRFRDPETHSVRTLEELWPGQETLWTLAHEEPRLVALKGRQVGLTTVTLAFVAEHFLATPNAQVNVLSREEGSALDLLERLRFGLAAMGVQFDRETYSVLEVGTDTEDLRRIEAFTSARDATRGRTASLVLLDEWAAMQDPARILRAVEPTSPRIVILFTSAGPDDPTSEFYRRSRAGQTGFRAVFVGADQRPDRTPEWWREKERTTDALTLQREYPRDDESALAAGGSHIFQTQDLADIGRYSPGRSEPRAHSDYIIGIDLASKRGGDKSVYVVLEGLDPEQFGGARWNVAHYVEFQGTDYATQGAAIASLHGQYNEATLGIEETGVGAGVIDNLDVPEDRIVRLQTTQAAKQRRLGRLEVAVRTHALVYDPTDFPELHTAMLGAVWGEHTPDAVMALSFALAVAEENRAALVRRRSRRGRFGGVWVLETGEKLGGGPRTGARCPSCGFITDRWRRGADVCTDCERAEAAS
jgi:hypothetical protein